MTIKRLAHKWYSCIGKVDGRTIVGHGVSHAKAIEDAWRDWAVVESLQTKSIPMYKDIKTANDRVPAKYRKNVTIAIIKALGAILVTAVSIILWAWSKHTD